MVKVPIKPSMLLTNFCLGAFGNVKIGWLKTNPEKKFAIKTMKKNDIIQSKHVDHIENEKSILEHLNHPFTVSYRFKCVKPVICA